MKPPRVAAALFVVLIASSCNCGANRLWSVNGGTLRVTLISADSRAQVLDVVLRSASAEPLDTSVAIVSTPMEHDVEAIAPGGYSARLVARDGAGLELQSVLVTDLEILSRQVTEIVIDMSHGASVAAETCNGEDDDGDGQVDEALDLAVCTECRAGAAAALADDARCGAIDCGGLDAVELRGDNSAAGSSTCVRVSHPPLQAGRCEAAGRCVGASGAGCTQKTEVALAQAGLCHTLAGCEAGAPTVEQSPDGTPCGGGKTCQGGTCGVVSGGGAGCSDGTREGFVDQASYPDIAGCSGAWSVPGVTRPNLVPTCGRGSGNSSGNADGSGCAAADLCEAGWHVCAGSAEVGQKANGSCADAVPSGTPDKMLFFAVAQASQNNTTCDTSGDNDVFGCGNLGTQLTAVRNCGVLTRALASTQSGTCGFNEAEPSLGPWQCLGGADSHLHEGALVTKHGCGGGSCSYNGGPIGNADKGGVLCCRD